MSLIFPSSPTIGLTTSIGDKTWQYNGEGWQLVADLVVGTQGTQGLQGQQGSQGTQGLQGQQGTQGTQGLQGQQGTQGTQGLQGQQGFQGLQGLQGLSGQSFNQGSQGLQGTQGSRGSINLTTAATPPGSPTVADLWVDVDDGTEYVYFNDGNTSQWVEFGPSDGAQGIQGTQGTQGIQGPTASQGAQGVQGLSNQGTQGLQGQQGSQGSQGPTGTLSAVGSNTQVFFNNAGTPAGASQLTYDNGAVIIGGGTSTGTVDQDLQVTGGAYVSGSIGIGITLPSQTGSASKVHISGGNLKLDDNNSLVWGGSSPTYIRGFSGGGLGIEFNAGNDRTLQYSSSVVAANISDLSPATTQTIDLGRSSLQYRNTWIGGNLFVGAAASTGTANQNLQVTGGASFTGVGASVGIGTTRPTAIVDSLGSATNAPLVIRSGGVLATSAVANALENDNMNLFYTQNDVTNGHKQAIVPAYQFKRLAASGGAISATTAGTAVSWLGTTSGFAMLAGEFYEMEAVLFYTKTTAAITTLTLTSSVGNFTTVSAGFPIPSGTTTMAAGGTLSNGTTSPVTIPGGSFTAATGMVLFKAFIIPVSNTRVTLNAFVAAGSITPLLNSYVKVTCLGNTSPIGNIA